MVSSIYNPNTLTANCYNPELCRANLTGVRKNPRRSMSDGLDEWQISGRSLISRSVDTSDQTTQPHHFSVAREQGYGTVGHLRLVDNRNTIEVALMMGKARVS